MKEKVVIVSGLSGSGKSNLVECIAEKFNLNFVHTSALLKELMQEKKAEIKGSFGEKNLGWWESIEAKQAFDKRLNQTKFDELLDKKLLELIGKGNIVMDSWTMGYLNSKGFKIWLNASIETRAKRIAKRNNQSFEEVLKAIKLKEEKTTEIYKKIYGFTLGEELEKFDLVIDTEKISEKKVREIALNALKKVL
jgi:predicted cytidylate kinase